MTEKCMAKDGCLIEKTYDPDKCDCIYNAKAKQYNNCQHDEESKQIEITDNNSAFNWKYTCGYCGESYTVNDDHSCMQGIVVRVAKLEEHINRDNEERAKFNEWWDKRHSPKAIVDEWKRNVAEVAEWKRKASER